MLDVLDVPENKENYLDEQKEEEFGEDVNDDDKDVSYQNMSNEKEEEPERTPEIKLEEIEMVEPKKDQKNLLLLPG